MRLARATSAEPVENASQHSVICEDIMYSATTDEEHDTLQLLPPSKHPTLTTVLRATCPSIGHEFNMASLDRSIRSCTHQVTPTCIAVTAIIFVSVVLVFSFQGNTLYTNVSIGFTATLGALIGLFLLGKLYVFFRGPPEPVPDEELPSSTDSNLHPTMAPMQSRQEPQDPRHSMGPRQMEEVSAHDRSSPDFRDVIPRPLNVPARPQAFNTLPRAQDDGNRYPRPGPGPSGPRDCPPSLQPGPSRHQQPHVSPEPEEARRQNIDVNGSAINDLPSFRAHHFAGSGYGDLPRSAPGIHTNHLHVNFVVVPSCTDFQLFCIKHNLLIDTLHNPKLRPDTPNFRKSTPQAPGLWARRSGVKKHCVKISSPTTLVSPTMQIIIDDKIDSVHSESSAGTDSPSSSGPPSSTDTLISMEISKA